MRYALAAILLLASALAWSETTRVEVVQVAGRPAAELLGSIRPLLGPGASVSAYHDKLIVKGTPQEIDAVRSLLTELDRPARRLIIEVRQSGGHSLTTRDFGYGLDTGELRIGRAPPDRAAAFGFRSAQTRGREDGLQRVQALDGRPALIRTGQSVPVYQEQSPRYGYGVQPGYQVDYRDLVSGFYALPRVHGNQVTIEIYQQHEREAGSGRFNRQQASSVLNGQLGQWLTLGSVGGADSVSRNAIGYQAQTRRAQDRLIELRVLPVN